MKEEIKSYYGSIAKTVAENAEKGPVSCGCGAACCDSTTKDYLRYGQELLEGLPEEALNASLGCANPIGLAALKEGETVLDLGSGGGIDALIASKYVGETGKIYGLDMTDEMLNLAKRSQEKMGVRNVEFIKGEIESIPLESESIDVITSNCVINLTENKEHALKEAYRVLKKGGRLAIADIVQLKPVPDSIKQDVQLWVGCISGALSVQEYEQILDKVGFRKIEVIPANLYTKEAIKAMAEGKGVGQLYKQEDEALLDGAFAGAHVSAVK